uniref:PIH1 domain-containing protein 1 n=1 Tax=Trichuris muris TaxID=70415 RepID=A0A5S6QBJ0_TRIMR
MSSSNIVPAFCMRSRTSLGKRVYLNFCVCDDVPCPKLLSELELASILDSPDPERYRLPVFISKKTSISDQSDESCDVYCIAFNKSFYEKRVKTSALHRKFLIALGVQEVEKKHNIVIDPLKLRELRNTQAMGDKARTIDDKGDHLLAEFRLNGVTNKEGIQLMAGQRRIRLVVPRHYHLDVVLPVRFDSSSTEAEFNADNFVLKAEFRVIEE